MESFEGGRRSKRLRLKGLDQEYRYAEREFHSEWFSSDAVVRLEKKVFEVFGDGIM